MVPMSLQDQDPGSYCFPGSTLTESKAIARFNPKKTYTDAEVKAKLGPFSVIKTAPFGNLCCKDALGP